MSIKQMEQAYWNEPMPLQRAYPDRHEAIGGFYLQLLGGIMLMVALIGVLPGARDFPGTWQLFLVFLFTPMVLAALLFFIAPHVGRWDQERIWKRAFVANNADLNLDYRAIKKTIRLLRRTTTYFRVNFEEVAVNLACALRSEDPFDAGHHTTFSWEVLHAYFHFHDGSNEIQPSRCPRA